MANLFICPFKHEKVSAEGYLAGDSIQRFRRRLETVKESGICWFKSNNGHQLAGSVNTFTDSGSKKCGVLSKGFLTSKSKPVFIPFIRRAALFESGEGNIQLSNICGETGKTQTKLPNSTKES